MSFEEAMLQHRLVAILRGVDASRIAEVCAGLVDGGFRLIEVSFTDDDAARKINGLRKTLPDEIHLGAGTVTTLKVAQDAHAAGATYFVTPHVVPQVVEYANAHELPVICGALTPTEIAWAHEMGSAFIKVFPASAFGPAYFKALLSPYPYLRLIAVGGVNSANLADYLAAGAVGAGVRSVIKATGQDGVAALAREMVEIVERVK